MTDKEISETIPQPYRLPFIATVKETETTGLRLMALIDSPVRELTQDALDVMATFLLISGIKLRISPCLRHLFVQDDNDNFQSYHSQISLGELMEDLDMLIDEWKSNAH